MRHDFAEPIRISDSENDIIDDSNVGSDDSDGEDIVLPRTRLAKTGAGVGETLSKIEFDGDPIRVTHARLHRNRSIPVTPRSTSSDESAFLERHYGQLSDDEYGDENVNLRLEDFCIYKRGTTQLESLHQVAVHDNKARPQYSFAGTLVHEDGSSQKVSDVDIWHVSIDNLAGIEEDHTPSTASAAQSIYLETVGSSEHNCFYLLGVPSPDYKKIYEAFQWLVDLLKHITDFLTWSSMFDRSVCFRDFHKDFIAKIEDWHKDVEEFRTWHARCGHRTDFRQSVAFSAHLKFIYFTIESITDDREDLLDHLLWEDLGLQTSAEDTIVSNRTLVTKHIAECFLESFPQWDRDSMDILEVVHPEPAVLEKSEERSQLLKLSKVSAFDLEATFEVCDNKKISKAALFLERASESWRSVDKPLKTLIGHAIAARQHTDRCSQPCTCDTYKIALVLSASNNHVSVRWLELPMSTTCAGRHPNKRQKEQVQTYYPIGNEVFLSDQCCCIRVAKGDILAFTTITIGEDHATEGDELFVHRKWVSDNKMLCAFVSDEIGRCPEHDEYEFSAESFRNQSESELQYVKVVSLFSGLGLLDYGLFEGSEGFLTSICVVEMDRDAILSFRANHKGTQHCDYLNTDANHPFRLICEGTRAFSHANCIVAGCPCRGFSRRNKHKSSINSQKQCTLLAHTLSWIDILRPEMVLIENVPGMDETKPSALGQAVCCLVSIGHQVKVATIKASAYGAATTRERIFLMATAPDVPLPVLPPPTHGADRHLQPMVTSSAVISDLPPISNDTLLNPELPFHVPAQRLSPVVHKIVVKVPRTPRLHTHRMANVTHAKLTSQDELEFYDTLNSTQKKSNSGVLRRAHPNQPFRTLTTSINAMDAWGPGVLHPVQDRVMSLLEFRRFQGMPDGLIQIGPASKQFKQAGNSVEYTIAKVLGRSLALAWKTKDLKRSQSYSSGVLNGMVIELLSDDEDIRPMFPTNLPRNTSTSTIISVNVPTVDDVRRHFRQSLSIDPSVDTSTDVSCPTANVPWYDRRMRAAVLDDDDDDDNNDSIGPNNIGVIPESVEMLHEQTPASDDDDLASIDALLTPSRLSSKDASTEPTWTPRRPFASSSYSRQAGQISIRRRRRGSSDQESDEEESPSKKSKIDYIALSSKPICPGVSTSSYSISSQVSQGASSGSPIVLSDSE